MKVTLKVDCSEIVFLTLKGIQYYRSHDLGMFSYGMFIVYERGVAKWYFEWPVGEEGKEFNEVFKKSGRKDFNSFIKWYGKLIGTKLSETPSIPFGIPIWGLLSEAKLIDIELEVLEIDLAKARAALPV